MLRRCYPGRSLGFTSQVTVPIFRRDGRVLGCFEVHGKREAADHAKDQFLATLSHELRTPLTAILGWTRLLRSGRLDTAATAGALETIERNTRLQTQLIEDLLDVSRIISGKLQLDREPVASAEDRSRALAAGYQRHLAKPVDPADLIDAVIDLADKAAAAVEGMRTTNE